MMMMQLRACMLMMCTHIMMMCTHILMIFTPRVRMVMMCRHLSMMCTCMLTGLIYVTQGGNYVLKMVDSYASGWNVIIICITETTVISYLYGYNRFAKVW